MSSSDADSDREPTILGLLGTWWRYRWKLLAWIVGGAVVAVAGLVGIWWFQPSQPEGRFGFRLLFTGVEQGKYPNGTRFTPADIISEPVLRKVYDDHKLQDSLTFDEFSHAFAVLGNNPALKDLREEYAPRLSNTGLSAVERQRLEDEYASKVSAVRSGDFVIAVRFAQAKWPGVVNGAVITDILNAWLAQARAQGAFQFNLDVYSANILSDIAPLKDDYLMLIDRLRVTIDRILKDIDSLEAIPGAALVRAGKDQVTLDELKSLLRDDLEYRLTLIQTPVYGLGLYRDRDLAQAYLSEQLSRIDREKAALTLRADGTQRALASYAASGTTPARLSSASAAGTSVLPAGSALIPQLSDSFLDRLVDASGQQADLAFRQQLTRQDVQLRSDLAEQENQRQVYANALAQLNQRDPSLEAERKNLETWVGQQTTAVLDKLTSSLDNLQALYREISRRSLEPASVFTVTESFHLSRATELSPLRLTFVFGLLGMAYTGVVLLAFSRQVSSRNPSGKSDSRGTSSHPRTA